MSMLGMYRAIHAERVAQREGGSVALNWTGYERKSTDEQRAATFMAEIGRDANDQRAGQAVVNDLIRCEACLETLNGAIPKLIADAIAEYERRRTA